LNLFELFSFLTFQNIIAEKTSKNVEDMGVILRKWCHFCAVL